VRAADGRRALRRGIALGLTAGLVSVAVGYGWTMRTGIHAWFTPWPSTAGW
jgi:hypothetical protein